MSCHALHGISATTLVLILNMYSVTVAEIKDNTVYNSVILHGSVFALWSREWVLGKCNSLQANREADVQTIKNLNCAVVVAYVIWRPEVELALKQNGAIWGLISRRGITL